MNFEEDSYTITEGETVYRPDIRLHYRNTQRPFNVSLFAVTISGAINMFNASNFINTEYVDSEATEGKCGSVQLLFLDVTFYLQSL